MQLFQDSVISGIVFCKVRYIIKLIRYDEQKEIRCEVYDTSLGEFCGLDTLTVNDDPSEVQSG